MLSSVQVCCAVPVSPVQSRTSSEGGGDGDGDGDPSRNSGEEGTGSEAGKKTGGRVLTVYESLDS